ncbi:MAG: hypothetical protein IJS37_02820 [Bacilli bacterium]|nr:hypothetical protein [Bacilli bacterium]
MAANKERRFRAVVSVVEGAPPMPKALYKEMCGMFAELAVEWIGTRLDSLNGDQTEEAKRRHTNELHRREYAIRKAKKRR